jgi:hypothetical protein
MSEVLRPEVIQPKKATLADRAISWMCDHWQKDKPGNFRDRKNKVFVDRVVGMEGGEERERLEEINQRELSALELIRNEMETQQKLVKEAQDSGKRIVLIGHEKGYLEQAMGGNFKDTKVVSVVSGHNHQQNKSEGKNSSGETIHYLNVGADQKVDSIDGSKPVLSGFALRIKDDERGLVMDIQEIIPDESDYQEAIHSM